MTDNTLDKQYAYYVAHEDELLKLYNGKHLVISDKLQVFPFNNMKEAYFYGAEHFGGGHFLLQECRPGILNVVHQINCYM